MKAMQSYEEDRKKEEGIYRGRLSDAGGGKNLIKKKSKTILLRCCGWLVVHDSGWPGDNICVFREPQGTLWGITQRLPSHGVAYCSSLENALLHVFRNLVIENAGDEQYKGSLSDLRKAIYKAKREFDELLTLEVFKFKGVKK